MRALGERGLSGPETDRLYDAFRNPRRTRAELPLLGVDEALAYAEQVRDRALRRLEAVNDEDVARTGPLLDGGFVYGMVAQHEQQHVETLVATLQLVTATVLDPLPSAPPPPARSLLPPEVHVPGGSFEMGTDEAWAYDNERPGHEVDVPAFFIDRYPVTNGRVPRLHGRRGIHESDATGTTRAGRSAEQRNSSIRCSGAAPGTDGSGAASERGSRFRLDEPVQPRLLARGERVRAVGRPEASHRGRVGEGGGRDSAGHGAPLPLGRWRPRTGHGRTSGRGGGHPAPVGAFRAGASAFGCRADDRRRLGVDGVRLPAISGVSSIPVPGVFGRLLRQ